MGKQPQDYRDLLKAHILQKKEKNARYTQSYFAQKMDVSKSYLAAVLACKKHLSADKLDILCRALQMKPDDCMSLLISYASQVQSQKYLMKTVAALHYEYRLYSATRDLRNMSRAEKALLTDEVRSTLFSLMSSIPNGNVQKAHATLRNKKISLAEVKSALAWLEDNDFLKLETHRGGKKYKAIQSYLRGSSQPGPQKYIPWLENAIEVLENPEQYSPLRVQSSTFSFDDKTLLQLQDEYTKFLQRTKELSDQSSNEGKVIVLYLQNLFYTLAAIDNSIEDSK
ncbi:hypothetical protein [Bdellovibrio sp. BCCA]|uniref:hypothetical protein n=1 Tax=Bdellovibrio sp. BCCA TaxID=3136281 RepID=UPI0030F0092D